MPDSQSTVEILLKIQSDKGQLDALKDDFQTLAASGTKQLSAIGDTSDQLLAKIRALSASIKSDFAAAFPEASAGALTPMREIGATVDGLIAKFSAAGAAGAASMAAIGTEAKVASVAVTAASNSTAQWSPRMLQAAAAGAAWNAATNSQAAAAIGLNTAVGKTAANFVPATAAQRAASVAMKDTEVNAASLARGIDQMSAGFLRAVPGAGALAGEVRALGGGAITTAAQVGLLNTVLIGAGIAGALAFAAALASIVTKGIEVQKALQDLGEGVQGTLSTDSNFGAAASKDAGPEAIKQITQSAKDAQVPITDLAKAFDQVFPAAVRANTTIKGLSDVISRLISEEDALHIPQGKLITDLEQIFNGSVRNTNQLAQELGITKEQAAAARESGTTTDLLIDKQKEFASAHEGAAETISRAEQTVKAAFEQLAVAADKPIIQPLTTALSNFANQLNDPSIQAGVSSIIAGIASVANAALSAIPALVSFGNQVAAALNAANNFASKAGQAAHDAVFGKGTGILGIQHAPLSPGDQKRLEAAGIDTDTYPTIASDTTGGLTDRELPGIEVKHTGLSPVVGGGKGGGGGAKGPSQDTEDQKEISDIMSQINEKQTHYNELVEKAKVDHELGLTSLSKEQETILSSSTAYSKSIDEGIAKLTAEKQKIEDLGNSQGGLNTKEDQQVNKIQAAIDKLTSMKSKLDLINAQNTFGGQFTIGLQKFADTLQLTGTKASEFFTSTLTTGINSASTALTGLIFQTGNWRQTFEQAAESIVQNLIKIGLQYAVGLALEQTTNAASRLENARTAATGAWSSASSIPLVGWIIGPIAAAAAFAGALAYASGGIVEGSPSNSDNRIARVATGEGIVTSRAVQYYGAQHIHNLNSLSYAGGGIVGGSGSFGSQGGGGTASRPVNIHNYFDASDMRQTILNHPEAENMIVNVVRKNRFAIKV